MTCILASIDLDLLEKSMHHGRSIPGRRGAYLYFLKHDRGVNNIVAIVVLTHHGGKMANGAIIQQNAMMK